MDDTDPVAGCKQRKDLLPHPGEPASLDLDEQVAPDEIDDVPVDRHLDLVAGRGIPPLQGRVQVPLSKDPDRWGRDGHQRDRTPSVPSGRSPGLAF
jgi:hypothetical protein